MQLGETSWWSSLKPVHQGLFRTAVAVIVVAAVVLLGAFRRCLDWGNVPTWFAGGFAVIASTIAFKNYRVARQALAIATAKADDDEAKQARLVVLDETDYEAEEILIRARNYSTEIVHSFSMRVWRPSAGSDNFDWQYTSEEEDRGVPDRFFSQVLNPGEASIEQTYTALWTPFQVHMSYTDARGVRWERINERQPVRVVVDSTGE